ncbi:MAG: GntR family transcriptional regulator [Schaalia hyovaginalis]|uniref:GntR family transcriptional regulator n=1 Tax=Schaalia hyovaginalis TaxID=29316 RepID=UPI0012B37EF9|nr:GntR family transcriptional regulator [Schaalia hyovaginalis]MCI7672443.1 GntR family transcriptional regulator [Schaalia hyovaginalis]MDY3666453.1 GntR family transcriptional regulator [Schaalia hyovaginalis]MDY4261989.1 GntR family transcriptional regulator [Schaalia hyovaginalis]MDY5506995.1 GntR family transcriptional regulator [Schaalia hyovaginalis]MST63340.1 GntR family transcriptional regulator [Schaalia hyovaginalis]
MDLDATTPIYIQIAEDIRRRILIGDLLDGDQVMSTTQYATTYRINPATAAKAFSALVDDGLLVKRRGIGMFIAQGAHARLIAQRRSDFIDARLAPLVEEALALGLDPEELVNAIRTLAASRAHDPEEHR